MFCETGNVNVIPNVYNNNSEIPENCPYFKNKDINICDKCAQYINAIKKAR